MNLQQMLARQQEILSNARSGQRSLTEEEQTEFDNLQRDIDAGILPPAQQPTQTAEGERGSANNNGAMTNGSSSADSETNAVGGGTTDTGTRTRGIGEDYSSTTASAILAICRQFNVEPDAYIQRGLSVEATRIEIMNGLMARNQPVSTSGITDPVTGVRVQEDAGDKFRSQVTDGILLRADGSYQPTTQGRNIFIATSIRDIAIDCLERENPGQDYRHMDANDLYSLCSRSFYNPTAAFPAILDSVIQKSYVQGLEKSKTTFEKWCKVGTLTDFKTSKNHEYIMGYGGDLSKVGENGELKAYVPKDALLPTRSLETYGEQFTMSRQAFINDDIGLITTMPRRYAEKSQRTQNKQIYGLLVNNNKIFDGKTFFNADRRNTLKTGSDVTLQAIQSMILRVSLQKDETGEDISLTPDLFIVPVGLGVAVHTLLSSPTIHTADNTQAVNPYAKMSFEVVEDVTLNTLAGEGNAVPWFMGCENEIIQVDYLNGQKVPTIRRSEKAGTLGFVWDFYHDWGVSVLHPQAIVRNPGVKILVED